MNGQRKPMSPRTTRLPRGTVELQRTELRRVPFERKATITRLPVRELATVTPIRPDVELPVAPVIRWPTRKHKASTDPDAHTVSLVLERDKHCCVICGRSIKGLIRGLQWSIHHRRDRGSGGCSRPDTSTPVNLITVCGSGTTGCHGEITRNASRIRALKNGWIVLKNGTTERTSPALIPVFVAGLGLRYATHDGRWVRALPTAGGHLGDDAA